MVLNYWIAYRCVLGWRKKNRRLFRLIKIKSMRRNLIIGASKSNYFPTNSKIHSDLCHWSNFKHRNFWRGLPLPKRFLESVRNYTEVSKHLSVIFQQSSTTFWHNQRKNWRSVGYILNLRYLESWKNTIFLEYPFKRKYIGSET